jgi:flagellar motor switch protein FliN/FliY
MTTIDDEAPKAAFLEALASVVSALLDKKAAIQASAVPPEAGYVLGIGVPKAGAGVLYLHFDRTQADALAKRMADSQEALQPPAVLGSLKELCGQALTTFMEQRPPSEARPEVVSAQPWSDDLPWVSPVNMELTVDGEPVALRMALSGTLALETEGDQAAAPPQWATPSGNIDVILDIDLPLVVRFGRTEMSIRDLTNLVPGALIDLGRSPDDPVDVMVSNQIVARGEVVTVGGSYGVRIRDVINPVDRIRTMGVEL